MAKILVVGAGLSGAVLAQQLAAHTDHKILIVDERPHVAGNCHTARHAPTGIMTHVYGPHIFNTSDPQIWQYIQNFGQFGNYVNRVKAVTALGVFSLPINLLTINQLFKTTFNPREAQAFIHTQADASIDNPSNFEEQALKSVGPLIYEAFFRDYTIKQWGCDPKELPASILKRLPIRFNYDDRYYSNEYQGIPIEGYTVIVERMLAHPNIVVRLSERYDPSWNHEFDYVFYSGPIDAYFGYREGRLGYRSLVFRQEIYEGSDYQGNAVLNYCQGSVPYTRIHEHAHFTPWEPHHSSIYFCEFSKETEPTDTPFYPKRLRTDKVLLMKYRALGALERNVSFLGRLGTYRYLDMQHVVKDSIAAAMAFACSTPPWDQFPAFLNAEAEE